MIFDKSNIGELASKVSELKRIGLDVVFTNGVFDILHLGHVTYLAAAKKEGHFLIVGVNADTSVKRLGKGDDRPINDEIARATIIDALQVVDHVVIFEEDTPLEVINSFKPNVLVKGGDYDPAVLDTNDKRYIVGSKEVRADGGTVKTIPIVDGYSTTNIISKINS